MSPSSEELVIGRDALAPEIARRRTFAIISHPDAGKTTLTEKLLLYAGAIELAGAVRGRKTQRHAMSDWMEMEQQRGISISAAALEFELDGHRVTLLDTPGHQDFSEDTYRTLLAVDSVVMVLDAAKGIEPQTLKLFEVCRDRAASRSSPSSTSSISRRAIRSSCWTRSSACSASSAAPMNWPLGDGHDFRGVYDLERTPSCSTSGRRAADAHGAGCGRRAPTDPMVAELVGRTAAAGTDRRDRDHHRAPARRFDRDAYRARDARRRCSSAAR